MSWNYRVIRRRQTLPGTLGTEDVYAIHEVYYDEQGEPKMVSAEPSPLLAETLQALNETRMLMAVACRKPVLEWEDIVLPRPGLDARSPATVAEHREDSVDNSGRA